MSKSNEYFLHPIKDQDDKELSEISKSYQEQQQRDSVENKLHNQNGYLVAKVRKDGKLHNVSSGVKVPPGLIWNLKSQSFEETHGNFHEAYGKHKLRIKYNGALNEARKDLDARITAFKKLGDPKILKRRKETKDEPIKNVNQALENYTSKTKKNWSIINCITYQLSKYKGSKRIEDFDLQKFYNSIKGVKVSTKNKYISVLNGILFKTTKRKQMVELERQAIKSPEILTKEQVAELESSNHKHASAVRLLLYTGIRSGELPDLVEAFRMNPQSDSVKFITSKTQRERRIPLKPKIRKELESIKIAPKYKTLWKYFNDKYSANLHMLRATFITNAYRDGKTAGAISKAIGHSSVATTIDHYLKFENQEIDDVFE